LTEVFLELIYGKSTVLLDATSSQNSSQWNNTESVNGSNVALSRSDFDQGRRIISNGNATLKWNKFTKTRIGVFYEGAQGTLLVMFIMTTVVYCKIHF
jgi:hypothetical protein